MEYHVDVALTTAMAKLPRGSAGVKPLCAPGRCPTVLCDLWECLSPKVPGGAQLP